MIPLETALQIIREVLAAPRTKSARVPLREALGRVLTADVASPLDFPHFDRAAMDGWAIPVGGERRYRVVGVLNAGDTATIAAVTGEGAPPLADGTTMKVMTGAPVPPGTARVVPVELAREGDGTVEITATGDVEALPACIHTRGQDVTCGEVVARAGERLTAVRLANLLSVGVEEVSARRRPRVTIAPTGDELVARAADLAPGRILDTNGPLLEMILREAGCTAGAHVAIPDDPRETKARLAGMLGQSDLVVLTGGVSAGDRDFVPDALRALDFTVHFDRVAVQPGKPTLFATGARGVVFALPGNPVSAFVTAHLFVLPALALLEGAREWPRFVTLPLAEAWRGRPRDRVRLYPAQLTRDGAVSLLPYHGSGHLRALIEADGLVRIEPEWDGRAAEAPVQFWPLRVAAFGLGEGEETA